MTRTHKDDVQRDPRQTHRRWSPGPIASAELDGLSYIKQVDGILLDFAKDFHKVPHKRLTCKLRYYDISGPILHWITAFMTNRTQRVFLDGSSSDAVPVSSGVPQGTVLGPFFSYFILMIFPYQHLTLPLDFLLTTVYCIEQ